MSDETGKILDNEKLNLPSSTEDDFSLEDILREFGGWSKPEEPPEEAAPPLSGAEAAEDDAEAETLVFERKLDSAEGDISPAPAPAPAPEPEPEPEVESAPESEPEIEARPLPGFDGAEPRPLGEIWEWESLSGGREAQSPEVENPEAEGSETEGPEEAEPPLLTEKEEQTPGSEAEKPKKPKKPKAEKKQKPPPPEKPEVSMQAAFKFYSKALKNARTRLTAVFLICLPLVYITFAHKLGWYIPAFIADYPPVFVGIFIAAELLVILLGYDVMARGVYDFTRLKPGVESVLLLSCLASLVDAALSLIYKPPSTGAPFCVIACVGVFFTMLGRYQKNMSIRRSLKSALMYEEPYVVIKEEERWEGRVCFFKARGTTEGFISMIESPDCGERVFSFYSPLLIVAALVLAALSAFKNGGGFFWSLAAIFAGALPLTAGLCFSKPFSSLSKRLYQAGAAIAGWEGAKAMDGDCAIVITDHDLFPKGMVSLNGLKVFGSHELERVTSYAASAIALSGSGLSELFLELLNSQSASLSRVDQFRCYEGGGLGAEIRGDLVLVGTASFMVLMGVRLPRGNKAKHAVYVSINGELAGMYALNYSPSASIRYSLQTVLKSKRLSALFATRDFVITPTMIKQRFKVPSDNLEFPNVEERMALAEPRDGRKGIKPAIVCRDGFVPFADVVIGGRWLKLIARANTVISVLSGFLGLILMFFLTFTAAVSATSSTNIMIYLLMWSVPVFLISSWISKY